MMISLSPPRFLRRMLVLAAIVGSACVAPTSTLAQSPPPDAAAAPMTSFSRDEAVLHVLEGTIVDVHYDRVDFEKIIQDVREQHRLNIHIAWTELEAAGVRRDQRIEMNLTQVSLATMLNLLLREAAAGSKAAGEVSYHVESGVVVIDMGFRQREESFVRVYDVTDLLESGYAIRRFANTPVLGMELTGREFVGGEERKESSSGGSGGFGGGGGGGKATGGSVFGESGEDPTRITLMERIQGIVNLIEEHVDPEGWRDMGGNTGSIFAHENALVIQNTMRGHQKIAQFLATIRESRPQPVNADVAIVRLRADKAAELRAAAGEGFPRIPDDMLKTLAMNGDAQGVLFRATSSGAAGQAMLFSALTQREAVTSMHAIVGDQSSAYQPESSTSTAGLELIVLPLLIPESDRMTLDVQMALVPPAQVITRPVRLGAGEAEATIDQVQRSMRTVSSQTALNVGDVIALTIPQELSPQGAAAEYEDWLLVRVRKAK